MFKLIRNESNSWVLISEDEYNEAIRRKRVVRKGKVIRKKISDKEGYRIDKSGKEVRMSPAEKRKRKKAARRAAIKRRAKKSQISRQRKKSDKIRKSRNI